MQTGIEKEGDQFIIASVSAIRERIEKATDRQSVASCISELIGLMNTPGISWSLIMELSLALQLALEISNKIPSITPVMPSDEILRVLNRAKELTDFVQELEEEKKKLGELDTQMVECIKEIQDLRKQWMKDPFSVEGLAAEKAMLGKMGEGIGYLDTMRQIIETREGERKQIQTRLANPETQIDEEFLRGKLKLIEIHLTESKGLYETRIDTYARELQSYITATTIFEAYKDKLSQPEMKAMAAVALSEGPTDNELKPIKDYLRQHKELSTGKGAIPLEKFLEEQVDKKVKEISGAEVAKETESKKVDPEAAKEDKRVVSSDPQMPEDRPAKPEAKVGKEAMVDNSLAAEVAKPVGGRPRRNWAVAVRKESEEEDKDKSHTEKVEAGRAKKIDEPDHTR